jgi:hypothetical protein
MLDKAEELRGKLQAGHDKGTEVVVKIGPDGVLRRGPVGADVNLTPGLEDFAPTPVDWTPGGPVVPATPTIPPTTRWPLVTNRSASAGDVGGAFVGASREVLVSDRT